MTRDELNAKWDSMTPRERDALIAEKVMGFKHFVGESVPDDHHCFSAQGEQEVWLNEDDHRYCKWCGDMPMFSEDISAAWEVVEKMKEATVLQLDYFHDLTNETLFSISPPLICKAALLAILEEVTT